jgi:hypothetical protein
VLSTSPLQLSSLQRIRGSSPFFKCGTMAASTHIRSGALIPSFSRTSGLREGGPILWHSVFQRFRQISHRLQVELFFDCAAHDEAITRRAMRLA